VTVLRTLSTVLGAFVAGLVGGLVAIATVQAIAAADAHREPYHNAGYDDA
jgi:ABC-type branched-subunit amino acid transport system permease subunit